MITTYYYQPWCLNLKWQYCLFSHKNWHNIGLQENIKNHCPKWYLNRPIYPPDWAIWAIPLHSDQPLIQLFLHLWPQHLFDGLPVWQEVSWWTSGLTWSQLMNFRSSHFEVIILQWENLKNLCTIFWGKAPDKLAQYYDFFKDAHSL